MSDVMLLGVLRMPMPDEPDTMTLRQFVSRARQAACRIEADADELAELRTECERLRAALAKANEQAERFERGWYLRGDALEKLQNWADSYPLDVFPEVLRQDWLRANEVLAQAGLSMSRMNASNMRHVINGVRETVAEGLKA
jgi:hypothetical protein